MAQTVVVNKLLGELIESFAGRARAKSPSDVRSFKDSAARQIKAQQYVRTNQFEVDATFKGLIEKFSIINRDGLADALNKRLNELQEASQSNWTPELLSLLLNLSDRPDEKSTLESLKLLQPPAAPPSSVTWAEIIADDPLTGELWLEEHYSSASDDEFENLDASDPTRATVDEEAAHQESTSTAFFHTVNSSQLDALKTAQFWNRTGLRNSTSQCVSELQIIREVLAMLRGLPTSLFSIDSQNTIVYYSSNVTISQISPTGLNDVLQTFASIGSDLLGMRTWKQKLQTSPLLQALNHSISDKLRRLDQDFNVIDTRFTGSTAGVVASILELHHNVRILTYPIRSLCTLVSNIPYHGSDFIPLELLYDEICTSQAAGNHECFKLLGKVFFDCLKVYLRPIATWMKEGAINEIDNNFFIFVVDKSTAASSLWHDHFALRTTTSGKLYTPNFLQPAAKRILNAGKSICFLRQLKCSLPTIPDELLGDLTFDNVCCENELVQMLPFSELLRRSIDDWINGRYGPASSILKKQLLWGCGLWSCGLWSYLDSLESMFLSSNSLCFQAFADGIFSRIDSGRKDWDDKFLLTELGRASLLHGVIHRDALSVRRKLASRSSYRGLEALTNIVVEVDLPWPIQNIVKKSSLVVYQDVLILLLQTRRAEHLLGLDSLNLRRHSRRFNRLCASIRHRLGWFASTIHCYVTETVTREACQKMRSDLSLAEDVDTMAEVHKDFVTEIHSSCLLTKNLAPIHDSIVAILNLSVQYTETQATQIRDNSSSSGAVISKRLPTSSTYRGGHRRGRRNANAFELDVMDDSSDDASEGLGSDDEDTEAVKEIERGEESYEERLQAIHDDFQRLLRFTAAGLRGVSRAGGNISWEMLAERLEWGLQRPTKGFQYP